jgi:hypothetical protein
MTFDDIINQRLYNQYLLDSRHDPLDVLGAFGAIQAQDFAAARWALGLRSEATSDRSLMQLFNEGKILRTHMLRPTWHFVLPQDIRWMLELTSPRVQKTLAPYYKKLGLSPAVLQKSAEILASALAGGNHFVREEIKATYEAAGIDTTGQRLSFLVNYAQLQGVVCSGAMHGKYHTVALLSERAPLAASLPRDESLALLAKRFFTAHGPATLQDFTWWSSLLMTDAKEAVALARLQSVAVDGVLFYFNELTQFHLPKPIVHILPNFDEYTVAYKFRQPFYAGLSSYQPTPEDLSHHIITLNGKLAGSWKWSLDEKQCSVQLNLFHKFTSSQKSALDASSRHLERFLERPVVVSKV